MKRLRNSGELSRTLNGCWRLCLAADRLTGGGGFGGREEGGCVSLCMREQGTEQLFHMGSARDKTTSTRLQCRVGQTEAYYASEQWGHLYLLGSFSQTPQVVRAGLVSTTPSAGTGAFDGDAAVTSAELAGTSRAELAGVASLVGDAAERSCGGGASLLEASSTESLEMPSAGEVDIFRSFCFQKTQNESQS